MRIRWPACLPHSACLTSFQWVQLLLCRPVRGRWIDVLHQLPCVAGRLAPLTVPFLTRCLLAHRLFCILGHCSCGKGCLGGIFLLRRLRYVPGPISLPALTSLVGSLSTTKSPTLFLDDQRSTLAL
jgi:hypothetical protein